jgi:hypothetical protein
MQIFLLGDKRNINLHKFQCVAFVMDSIPPKTITHNITTTIYVFIPWCLYYLDLVDTCKSPHNGCWFTPYFILCYLGFHVYECWWTDNLHTILNFVNICRRPHTRCGYDVRGISNRWKLRNNQPHDYCLIISWLLSPHLIANDESRTSTIMWGNSTMELHYIKLNWC